MTWLRTEPDEPSITMNSNTHLNTPPAAIQATQYDAVAKGFHWVMAALLISVFALGLYMQGLPFSPDKLKFYSWHKWAGICVLSLVAFRLIWRLTHRPPVMPNDMPAWQKIAAHAAHLALYLLMFAIPVSGWLMSSAKGVTTVLFGLWPLPDLVARDRELGDALQNLHWYLNVSLALFVAIHVLAVFKHHFLDKDDILRRMLPGIRSR